MSLDIYLVLDKPFKRQKGSGIFIRRSGQTVEISQEEWDRLNPGIEPVKFNPPDEEETYNVYHGNITHNLREMAREVDIEECLWGNQGNTLAKDLIDPLTNGLRLLKSDPPLFIKHNPPNGWGTYETLIKFTEDLLTAAKEYPEAKVEVSI